VPERPILEQLPSLKALKIPKDKKEVILERLSLLGIDDFSVYGDLDHLAERLKKAYE
jgi:hypothetical protein